MGAGAEYAWLLRICWVSGAGARAAFRTCGAAAAAIWIVEAAISNTPRAVKALFRILVSIRAGSAAVSYALLRLKAWRMLLSHPQADCSATLRDPRRAVELSHPWQTVPQLSRTCRTIDGKLGPRSVLWRLEKSAPDGEPGVDCKRLQSVTNQRSKSAPTDAQTVARSALGSNPI
jgi:hypothetical protein